MGDVVLRHTPMGGEDDGAKDEKLAVSMGRSESSTGLVLPSALAVSD